MSKPISDADYIASKGMYCPWCGSDSVWDGEPLDFHSSGNEVFHPMRCDDCGQEWTEEFAMTGYST